jgi:hypothetical protein
MAKTIDRLTELSARAKRPGKNAAGEPVAKLHPDGAGLFLKVTPAGKSWILRFTSPVDLDKKGKPQPKQIGLGGLPGGVAQRGSPAA